MNGAAILYADQMTDYMERAIDETECRRAKQIAFNEANGITPKGVSKKIKDIPTARIATQPQRPWSSR